MISDIILEKRKGCPSPLTFYLNAALAEIQRETLENRGINSFANIQTANQKLLAVLRSVRDWQNHPHHRNVAEPKVVWQQGSTRLLDYGEINSSVGRDGPPVLVIPSLVNRPYILDLSQENSLLRHLASHGLRPFLLDWGAPDCAEFSFNIAKYITERAFPALAFIEALTSKSVGLLGYCMGGTIAAAIAEIRPEINALCTIGAPWDFSKATGNRLLMQNAGAQNSGENLQTMLENLSDTFGAIPAEFLQYLFAAVDPIQFSNKFLKFHRMDKSSKAAKQFIIIEDWLADGIALAGPAAKDLLLNWHVRNQIVTGHWQVEKSMVDASKITAPGMFICGQKDSIAPLETTLALANMVTNARTLLPDTGHVGMIVGSNAKTDVINPIAEFLLSNAG